MKKMFVLTIALACLILLGTAGFRTIPHWLGANPAHENKNKCLGYTIIAFDKGIDCYGDTIGLVRRNGYAERQARAISPHTSSGIPTAYAGSTP